MITLSVTNDIHGYAGAVDVPIEDILYMQYSSSIRRVIVYTAGQSYYLVGPLSYWCNALNSSGYQFSEGDRTAAINLRKVVRMNNFFKTAYFDDSKIGCMLSKNGYEDLKKQLGHLETTVAFI
ncbi:LytTR family transcriptional regulator DNA-binding domain-containing protein [Paenibacillus donghaensis]|uniref:HTH LytTR-type domain-containing protein n=1 Tax=Paenibacillus donghaensis TaxID=414771 RepID=A0A2Z2K4Q0_9BACL|nr:LytTR family transcriptional regulator DNA-binding domain-containing protein [Paenibacillus donghaensis]ASA20896.1 hypothetical protein B9T62_08930 [Paenibacillus donghaensis]